MQAAWSCKVRRRGVPVGWRHECQTCTEPRAEFTTCVSESRGGGVLLRLLVSVRARGLWNGGDLGCDFDFGLGFAGVGRYIRMWGGGIR